MKKYQLNLTISANLPLNNQYFLLKLTQNDPLPPMKAGQFAQLLIDKSADTFLRRPISIHFIDRERNELWLLVQKAGRATVKLAEYLVGDVLNVLLPLGNSFSEPLSLIEKEILLVGGGVGVAPLLLFGAELQAKNLNPTFLLGARSEKDLLELDIFARYGTVFTTTEDGSLGEKGYVTEHSVLHNRRFDRIYTCGPTPMMKAVARYARERNINCEVSLENMMACGIGACLCCVEDTQNGHQCVCSEGPVFNINDLKWQ